MVNGKHVVLGVHVRNRIQDAGAVQRLFTEYGCNIKTRIGLHDVHGDYCAPNGLILLELSGDETVCNELKSKLDSLEGTDVQVMEFAH